MCTLAYSVYFVELSTNDEDVQHDKTTGQQCNKTVLYQQQQPRITAAKTNNNRLNKQRLYGWGPTCSCFIYTVSTK